jgi:hypothetical protein
VLMSELEMPTVITAIANPEAEGFVAGTLYAQGEPLIGHPYTLMCRLILRNHRRRS